MVGEALRQCVSLLEMIMNGGGGLFHGHLTDRKGLLHNVGAGCIASFIKSIRLGRRKHFLPISYTDEHMEPGSGSSVSGTHYKLSDCVCRGQSAIRQGLKIIIFQRFNRAKN